jgi:hypothetical protein
MEFKRFAQHEEFIPRTEMPYLFFEESLKTLEGAPLLKAYLALEMTYFYLSFGLSLLSVEAFKLLKPHFQKDTFLEDDFFDRWFQYMRQKADLSSYEHLLLLDENFTENLIKKNLSLEKEEREAQGLYFLPPLLSLKALLPLFMNEPNSLGFKKYFEDLRNKISSLTVSTKVLKALVFKLEELRGNPLLLFVWRVENMLLPLQQKSHPQDSLILLRSSKEEEFSFLKLIGISFILLPHDKHKGMPESPVSVLKLMSLFRSKKENPYLNSLRLLFNLEFDKKELDHLLQKGESLGFFFSYIKDSTSFFGLRKEILTSLFPYKDLFFKSQEEIMSQNEE